MKLLPSQPTEAMLQAMESAHMPFGCFEAAYHAAWLAAPKASAVQNRAIATMVGKLDAASRATPDVLECGCAHGHVCSSCERHREARRLAERISEALK